MLTSLRESININSEFMPRTLPSAFGGYKLFGLSTPVMSGEGLMDGRPRAGLQGSNFAISVNQLILLSRNRSKPEPHLCGPRPRAAAFPWCLADERMPLGKILSSEIQIQTLSTCVALQDPAAGPQHCAESDKSERQHCTFQRPECD